jgi:uncharacterized protein
MNEQSNIARHKKGHEAFNRNDMNGVRDFFAEDTVRHLPGRSPIAGEHRGRKAVLETFGKMVELTGRNMKLEPLEYLANDTKTAAIFRVTDMTMMFVLKCSDVDEARAFYSRRRIEGTKRRREPRHLAS